MSEPDGPPATGDAGLAVRLRARLLMPLIVSPMFLVSGVDLVLACCRAGVVGSLPALNARTSDILDAWLATVNIQLAREPAAAPYAVNLIVHQSNKRLEADLEICVRHEVPVIIAAVGSPRAIIERVHGYGGIVLSDAGSVRHARRAAESGVDGVILLAAGAGGNTGWLNPFAFVSEVRGFFDGPIVLAGAISKGRHVHAAEIMGADFAIAGTSFIAARESLVVDDYRQMLIRAGADDIVLTSAVTGIPTNLLKESLERVGFVAGQAPAGFDLDHERETLTAWRDIWAAGHGVGETQAVEDAVGIVARFRRDYDSSRSVAARTV